LEHAVGNFSVSERTEGTYNSVRELVDAYENGNPKAKAWWLESVRKLAIALASLTNILSPEIIVLGGGISAGADNALLEPLKKFMADYEWRPGGYQTKITNAKLGGYAGAMGAAYFAKNNS
jgi:glucokinase